jgi:hypothetical protein
VTDGGLGVAEFAVTADPATTPAKSPTQAVIAQAMCEDLTVMSVVKLTVVPPSVPSAIFLKQAKDTAENTTGVYAFSHPAGIVITGSPPVEILINNSSPALTVAGISAPCVVTATSSVDVLPAATVGNAINAYLV